MHQLSLFPAVSAARPLRPPLDEESETLLAWFRKARAETGTHTRSVAREVSQLRSLAREAGGVDAPLPLAVLFADLVAVARALCEPRLPIARSTGRARLVAAQRFIAVIGPVLGRDDAADLACLDVLLPARPQTGWHDAGILVAGTRTRRRRRGATLSPFDLLQIVAATSHNSDAFRAARDHALVALHCFSGLRAEEILALHWEAIEWRIVDGVQELRVWVERGTCTLHLPIPGPAAGAMAAYVAVVQSRAGECMGAVFRRSALCPHPFRYRAARNIVVKPCQRAGYGPVTSVELRAAFAA